MTRINQPQHSSFISATNTTGTSQTRETARNLPIPASALNILNRSAGRVATGQTGFDAPVSAQRAQLNLTGGEFETPAPRPRSPTAAPAPGNAPPLPESELRRALNEAHRLVYGNDANGAGVDNWMAQARKLAKENGNDFEAVKFALHSELTNAKKGAPLSEGTGPLPQNEVTRALQEAQQMLGGAPAGTDWAARARELAAKPGARFDDVKFALHGEMLAARSGRPVPREGQALTQNEVTRALDEAQQMLGGAPPGTDWAARAKELAALPGNTFDDVKFTLHKEMLAAKTGRPVLREGQALPESELRRALDEAHRMVYGNDANGAGVDNWMAQARKLAKENGNDFEAVKFALHSELMNAKKGAPLTEGSGPLPQSEATRALQEAQQMLGGAPAGTDWAARARELAAKPGARFDDVKFALHGEMLAAKSGRPVLREGQALPQSEVRRALDEAHQMVFGGNAAGRNLGAWMARAQELVALHGNNFDDVKFALQREMMDVKYPK